MAIWFQDSFTRANEPIETSPNWNESGGTHSFDVVNNGIAYTPGTGGIVCAARILPSFIQEADYYVQSNITHNGTNIYGIVARASNGAGDNADGIIAVKVVNAIRMLERQGDTFYFMGDSADLTWNNGQTYEWRLEVKGFDYEVFRDDVSVLALTGSRISAQGDAGIHKGDNAAGAGPIWEDFEVGNFAPPGTLKYGKGGFQNGTTVYGLDGLQNGTVIYTS